MDRESYDSYIHQFPYRGRHEVKVYKKKYNMFC